MLIDTQLNKKIFESFNYQEYHWQMYPGFTRDKYGCLNGLKILAIYSPEPSIYCLVDCVAQYVTKCFFFLFFLRWVNHFH